jgi:hypothetical protein
VNSWSSVISPIWWGILTKELPYRWSFFTFLRRAMVGGSVTTVAHSSGVKALDGANSWSPRAAVSSISSRSRFQTPVDSSWRSVWSVTSRRGIARAPAQSQCGLMVGEVGVMGVRFPTW